MRRADRLFRIVQMLRGRRLTTARQLADALEVSQRTVYRDIRDLSLSGVPVEGEAGVGYVVRGDYDLPPLMFDYEEIEALVTGARMAGAWVSPRLKAASDRALAKIASALPRERRIAMERTPFFVPSFHVDRRLGATLEIAREGIVKLKRLHFGYVNEVGDATTRDVRPLGLYFWGERWTLAAWCETRTDFRNFRLDRMRALMLGEPFPDEAGKRLEDFLRQFRKDAREA